MHLEVLSQVADSLREQRNLYFRRTGIRFVLTVGVDYALFCANG